MRLDIDARQLLAEAALDLHDAAGQEQVSKGSRCDGMSCSMERAIVWMC